MGKEEAQQCPLCQSRRLACHLKASFPSEQRHASAYQCTNSGYGRHPDILQCRDCRFVFLKERPNAKELAQLYGAVEDPVYEREEAGRLVSFDAHLARVEQVTGPPAGRRLLDVGAYTGLAVEAAKIRGWDAVGMELCRWAVESGSRRGRHLVLGAPGDESVRALGRFDVVTMWDVIEHLADPAQVLLAVRQHLRPGGCVVIHTMDVDSVFARLAGKRWPWYMEMHLFYFSPKTLSRLLYRVGFEPVHTEHRGRFVSVRYLSTRVAALMPALGRPIEWGVARLGLSDRLVRIGFGDLFTMIAAVRND